jgi:hypothetical protein
MKKIVLMGAIILVLRGGILLGQEVPTEPAWAPLKHMADLVLWAPKLIADLIKDPVGTVENRPFEIILLALISGVILRKVRRNKAKKIVEKKFYDENGRKR